MKKLIILILLFANIFSLPVCAKNAKTYTDKINIIDNFNTEIIQPETIGFKTRHSMILNNTAIPKNSTVNLEVIRFQKEKRWHRAGFILCKLKSYQKQNSRIVDVSDKNIYLEIRKYEKINPIKAAWTGIEIAGGSVASVFLPGCDVAYFFLKGLIFRDKTKNVFLSGVSSAYDNSIFWFPQKGKPIDLKINEPIRLKVINSYKAAYIKNKIDTENNKICFKKDLKAVKKVIKNEEKIAENIEKEFNELKDKELELAKLSLEKEINTVNKIKEDNHKLQKQIKEAELSAIKTMIKYEKLAKKARETEFAAAAKI